MKKIITFLLVVVMASVAIAQNDTNQHAIGLTAINYAAMGGAQNEWGFIFALEHEQLFTTNITTSSHHNIAGTYNIVAADSATYYHTIDINLDSNRYNISSVPVDGTLTLTYVRDSTIYYEIDSVQLQGTYYIYAASANLTEITSATTTTPHTLVFNDTLYVIAAEISEELYNAYLNYSMGLEATEVNLNRYLLELYDAPRPDDYDTIDMAFTASQVAIIDNTDEQGHFQLYGQDDSTIISFAIYSNTIAGTYDSADFDYDNTYAFDIATDYYIGSIYEASATVTPTEEGYGLTGTMITRNGHLLRVTMDYHFPVPGDTIDISDLVSIDLVDRAQRDSSYMFTGANDDSTNVVTLSYHSGDITGSYTLDDCIRTLSMLDYNGVPQELYSGTFNVTEIDGGYSVEGFLLCVGDHVFHFSMTYLTPMPVTHIYTGAELISSRNNYQFIATDPAAGDSISIYYTPSTRNNPTGSYTMEDCDARYCAIYLNGQREEIIDGNFNVTIIDDQYNCQLHGYFHCWGNRCYELYLSQTEDVTSIRRVDAAQVTLYPNPVTDQLKVQAEGVQEVQVIDMMGQVVARQQNAGTIDMSAMAGGAYIVRTVTANGVSVQRVIKR